MKKLIVSMLVAALCVPAMAGVTATTEVTAPGELTITLTADGTETTELVGVAIEVDSDVPVQTCAITESFFDVFVDSAFSAGSGYTVGDGVPTASQDAPGELALPATSFSVSVAGLDDDGIGEGTEEAPLTCTIVLTVTETANITLGVDTLRGGAVSYAGAETITGLPTTVLVETGPACWAFPCQTSGDYNGDDLITAIDVQGLLGAWAPNPYDPCADFNRDGFITAIDVQILLGVWGVGCP